MKDLLDKISSYNIFNNLLPGIVFVALVEVLTSFSFIQEDLIIGIFLYYFIGLVISRIGSVVIEPFLKKIKFVLFSEYSQFVVASKKDDKIDILSETNNMYRSFSSAFLSLIILVLYDFLSTKYIVSNKFEPLIIVIGLLALFLFSYRKQTNYISERVSAINSDKE